VGPLVDLLEDGRERLALRREAVVRRDGRVFLQSAVDEVGLLRSSSTRESVRAFASVSRFSSLNRDSPFNSSWRTTSRQREPICSSESTTGHGVSGVEDVSVSGSDSAVFAGSEPARSCDDIEVTCLPYCPGIDK